MRLTPIRAIRRDELIRAAFEIIKRDGLRAATIGNIAEAAGASKGIVHHYFEDKQDLIEHTMRYAHRVRRIDLVNRLRKAQTPSARLWAVISIILDEKYLQSGFCKAWVSFHAQTYSHERLARLHRVIHRRERSNLIHALSSFLPREDAALAALGIKAMMEGFRFRLAAVPPPDFDSRTPLVQVLAFLQRRVPDFDQSAALRY
jgi:TetR/AcrR family transcriptional repressor of bet genes